MQGVVEETNAILAYKADWNLFISEVLGVTLDELQKKIVTACQTNQRVSVVSGTGRGKDFVAACVAICALILTPEWDEAGLMTHNAKVVLSAPSETQVRDIMMAEIGRLWTRARSRGFTLPGQLNSMDIRTEDKEWFLIGFKSDEGTIERWTGWHAAKITFIITEATGLSDKIFEAIEGNLQGDSRILIVFNFNTTVGYAAKSQKSDKWVKFRLNSLTAPNVIDKEDKIPGQVGYSFVKSAIDDNCEKINVSEVKLEDDDFEFEGQWYRPNDWFRVKILAVSAKVAEDVLIPQTWVEEAQKRWLEYEGTDYRHQRQIVGADIAGMGRDSSVNCHRFGNYVEKFDKFFAGGKADHMKIAGILANILKSDKDAYVSIDTIGEGAGVYSRLEEMEFENVISCKYSESAKDKNDKPYTDLTGQYEFANMRAYLFWAVRDWLNPANDTGAMLPPGNGLLEEVGEIRWQFRSDGKIIIEKKEDIKKRLGKSTDEFDALANTFYPISTYKLNTKAILSAFR